MKKLTEDNLREIIDKQFDIAGYNIRYDEVKKDIWAWYMKYPTTEEKEIEFHKWLVSYLIKWKFCSKWNANKSASWIILDYWLTIK